MDSQSYHCLQTLAKYVPTKGFIPSWAGPGCYFARNHVNVATSQCNDWHLNVVDLTSTSWQETLSTLKVIPPIGHALS